MQAHKRTNRRIASVLAVAMLLSLFAGVVPGILGQVQAADAVTYQRVDNVSDLKDNGSYVAIVSLEHATGTGFKTDNFMLPQPIYVDNSGAEVALSSAYRTGFRILDATGTGVGNQTISGDYAAYEWTLMKSGDGWLLKAGEQYVTFAYKDANAATVTLGDTGTALSITEYNDTNTFLFGTASAVGGVTYYLDCNNRGLVCGYRSHENDAHIFLYEAVQTEEPTPSNKTVVIAGSDFQNPAGHTAGAKNITDILTQMKAAGYETADGFLFCGDYYYSGEQNAFGEQTNGQNAVRNAVSSVFGTVKNYTWAEGNHDDLTGLNPFGANDTEDYGVFVVHEDYYPTFYQDYLGVNSGSNAQKLTQNTADAMERYFTEKIEEGYTKPIFVVAHLPLQATYRTYGTGSAGSNQFCGRWARLLVDVMNNAAEAGLNIVYLFGHDHAFGYDSCVGGDAVCFLPGDFLKVANGGSIGTAEDVQINFTYLNAGYTGYYQNGYNMTAGAANDGTLTMTVFTIEDEKLTVERYSANGRHQLGNEGYYSPNYAAYDQRVGYTLTAAANTPKYASPQVVSLKQTITKQETLIDAASGITVKIAGTNPTLQVSAASVENTAASIFTDTKAYRGYAAYAVTVAGAAEAAMAVVTIPLDEMNAKNTVVYQLKNNELVSVDAAITDGEARFKTDELGVFILAEKKVPVYRRVDNVADLKDNGSYVALVDIASGAGSHFSQVNFMLPQPIYVDNSGAEVELSSAYRTGFRILDASQVGAGEQTICGEFDDYLWTLEKSGDNWLLKAGEKYTNFAYKDANAATVTLGETGTELTISKFNDTNTFLFGTASAVGGVTYYLDCNNRGLVCGYKSHANDSHIYLYEAVQEEAPEEPTGLTITSQPEDFQGAMHENAEFRVKVNSADVTYQWYYSNNGKTWAASSLTGNREATLHVAMLKYRDGQQYKCVIQDAEGNQVETEVVTMKLRKDLTILSQPSDCVVQVGDTATFNVDAKGEGLTYQWYFSNRGGVYWGASSATGSDTASMRIVAKAFRVGQQYKCVITDAYGNSIETTIGTIVAAQ